MAWATVVHHECAPEERGMSSSGARAQPRITSASEPVQLAEIARDPGRIEDLEWAAISAVVLEIAAIHGRLAARMASLVRESREAPADHLLGIDDAAAALGVGRDWLRRRTRTLPFAVPLGPGAIRYSAAGLAKWIARRTGGGK